MRRPPFLLTLVALLPLACADFAESPVLPDEVRQEAALSALREQAQNLITTWEEELAEWTDCDVAAGGGDDCTPEQRDKVDTHCPACLWGYLSCDLAVKHAMQARPEHREAEIEQALLTCDRALSDCNTCGIYAKLCGEDQKADSAETTAQKILDLIHKLAEEIPF